MRSMVDTEGPVELVSSRGDRGEDRKVDLIMREMRRYNVKVTALQETTWFRSEVLLSGRECCVTSGKEKPAQRNTVRGRRKGGGGSNCAHRLGNKCLEGSREAMEGMELQSSLRCLQLGGRSRDKLHVVSYYAPKEKDTFLMN